MSGNGKLTGFLHSDEQSGSLLSSLDFAASCLQHIAFGEPCPYDAETVLLEVLADLCMYVHPRTATQHWTQQDIAARVRGLLHDYKQAREHEQAQEG